MSHKQSTDNHVFEKKDRLLLEIWDIIARRNVSNYASRNDQQGVY
jgi:hypothetical protein